MSDRSSWNNQKRAISVLGLGGESANRLDTWMVWKFGPGWGVIPRPKDAKSDKGGAYLARKRHMQVVRTKPQLALSKVKESVVHGVKARRRAALRMRRYGSDGVQVGGVAAEAIEAMRAAAAAGATFEAAASPVYLWPHAVPAPLPTELHMDELTVVRRERILRYIEQGVEDLAKTHVLLSALVPDDAGAAGGTLSAASSTVLASDPLAAVGDGVFKGQGVEQQQQQDLCKTHVPLSAGDPTLPAAAAAAAASSTLASDPSTAVGDAQVLQGRGVEAGVRKRGRPKGARGVGQGGGLGKMGQEGWSQGWGRGLCQVMPGYQLLLLLLLRAAHLLVTH